MKKHIELLERLRPLTAYGLPGTRDMDQAALQEAFDTAQREALLDHRRLEMCIGYVQRLADSGMPVTRIELKNLHQMLTNLAASK